MHRHFKSKAVESARRKRFTVGMTQPQLARRGAADSQERSGHLPGIGSPPGTYCTYSKIQHTVQFRSNI